MTTEQILAALTALHKSIGVAIYGGNRFNGSYGVNKPQWHVTLKHTEVGAEVETSATAETFEAALSAAWDKLSRIAAFGLGDHALTPPIEAAALEYEVHPSSASATIEVDDEIPF